MFRTFESKIETPLIEFDWKLHTLHILKEYLMQAKILV